MCLSITKFLVKTKIIKVTPTLSLPKKGHVVVDLQMSPEQFFLLSFPRIKAYAGGKQIFLFSLCMKYYKTLPALSHVAKTVKNIHEPVLC